MLLGKFCESLCVILRNKDKEKKIGITTEIEIEKGGKRINRKEQSEGVA